MDMFAALAEPNRRSILEMLAGRGQLSATSIARKFQVSPPAISQHLKVLREAGLVRMEKRAQQHLYSVNTDTMREFEDWARRMAGQYEQQYDRLERILKAEQQDSANIKGTREKHNGSSSKASSRGNNRKDQAGR